MRKAIATLPEELARSVTWDQGKEMSNHKSFTVATGIPVYLCDPHSPWQRGSNENTNGLLRQYSPRAPIFPPTAPTTSSASRAASTVDLARRSAISHHQRSLPRSLR
jgi:IS30 family transposase